MVTVAGAINRETDGASLNITVLATSADTSTASQTFTIAIRDVVGITLPNSGGPFTVLQIGGELHVQRKNGTDLIAPTIFAETVSLTINAGSVGASVVLDSSMEGFTGAFRFNGGIGSDKLDSSRVSFGVTFDGGAANDTLLGGSGADHFLGGVGNDSAIGGGGNDSLSGGAGNDVLDGGDGEDVITGGLGSDRLIGGANTGVDSLGDLLLENVSGVSALSATRLTGAGTDTLFGFERVLLTGSDDNDAISASAAVIGVTLIGGAGNDTLTGGSGNDVLQGGDGNDLVTGGSGNDTLDGQSGDDMLTGALGDDSLDGGDGRDGVIDSADVNFTLTNTSLVGVGTDELLDVEIAKLSGGNSDNTLDASAFTLGGVTMIGGSGHDVLQGGSSADSLDGGAGNDVLQGNGGNDSLIGQAGDDTLQGNGGDDTLSGELGNDTLDGGTETDLLIETGNVNLTLSSNALTGLGTDSLSNFEEAILTGGNSANTLNAVAFLGTVTLIGGGGNDLLQGGSSSDFLDGGTGNDTLQGNDGNDTLTGGLGNDSLVGGAGTDRLVESANASFTLTNTSLTGVGTDSLTNVETVQLTGGISNNRLNAGNFSLGSVTLIGGAGNDTLIGGSSSDSLDGGIGDDFLTGRVGNDLLLGSDGKDTVIGGTGDDSLSGGNQDDLLIGGFGVDSISGDAGNDKALGGQGGPTRFGNSSSDVGDTISSTELIDETFSTLFTFE